MGEGYTLTYCGADLGPLSRSQRVQFTAWALKIPGLWVPDVHANCEHNVVAALQLRSLGSYPPPADPRLPAVERAFRGLYRLLKGYGGERWSLEKTAQSYSGSLGRRYMSALASLREEGPVGPRDYFLSAFLKAEKFCSDTKQQKPRMIFPRSPRYNLCLASWLKPLEHWLWPRLKGLAQRGVPKSRVCAKGLGPEARADLIVQKFRRVRKCRVFEVDGKSFEAHVYRRHLELEQRGYMVAFRGDSQLQSLLAHQLRLKGACGGVKFERDGGRASGDFNTGMGNTIVMLACVEAIVEAAKLRVVDCLCDGDNALLFVPEEDCSRAMKAFADLACPLTGQELTLEKPVAVLEHIRFGQSAPVFNGERWTMTRDWRKVLSHGCSSHKHLRDIDFAPRYLAGVALCEAHLGQGLPILGVWAATLWAHTRRATRRAASSVALEDYRYLGVSELPTKFPQLREPTREARQSFARAFGLEPDAQVIVEGMVSRAPFQLTAWKPEDATTQPWTCRTWRWGDLQ